jgi:tRNA threonylcarbamoyl adenosine modification protein YeaZ
MQNNIIAVQNNIIAVTACLKRCSIAIRYDGDIFEINQNVDAAQNLVFLAPELAKKQNINLRNINKIITTSGPGSFTGIRVAQSFTKGMALALKIPSASISYFDIIQHMHEKTRSRENASPPGNSSDTTLILIRNDENKFYYSLRGGGNFLGEKDRATAIEECVIEEGVSERHDLLSLLKELLPSRLLKKKPLATSSADRLSRIYVIGELTDDIIDDVGDTIRSVSGIAHQPDFFCNTPDFRNAVHLINWLADNPAIVFESLPTEVLYI